MGEESKAITVPFLLDKGFRELERDNIFIQLRALELQLFDSTYLYYLVNGKFTFSDGCGICFSDVIDLTRKDIEDIISLSNKLLNTPSTKGGVETN